MEILCQNISAFPNASDAEICALACKKLSLQKGDVFSAAVYKKSIDARHKEVKLVCSVLFSLPDHIGQLLVSKGKATAMAAAAQIAPNLLAERAKYRPVVVGFGPAGMFAALTLAKFGYRPLVLEMGKALEERVAAVESFWAGGAFSPRANVQFGEGGAGTFSDGKLTCRISDPFCRSVLEELVHFGAPKNILTDAKPHIGTDRLRPVVKAIREEILALGGTIRFETALDALIIRQGKLVGIVAEGEKIDADRLILAPGHSARSLFHHLYEQNIAMEQKHFSVGLRIEHRQSDLDEQLLHGYASILGHASYQFSHREGGMGVYTFCMCPGGQVVSSASGTGQLVTNGMSHFARDGENGNSALVAEVSSADFGGGLLDGIAFQEKLEHSAFLLGGGGGLAPCQTVGGFLFGKEGAGGRVTPSFLPGVQEADFTGFFPQRVEGMLKEGIVRFGKKLPCFSAPDAILSGVESRTSSPLRVVRKEDYESLSVAGLYPCGEGCGYAGGIMSAAVDGIRVAAALMQKVTPAAEK